jgi:hypothetical protein
LTTPLGLLRRPLRFRAPDAGTTLSLICLTLLVVFFLREALFGGSVFYLRDIHLQWYGQMESFVRAVSTGSWPLWDPYVSFGQPLLANANNQILYPITWLNLLVRPWSYYTFFFAFHLVFSAAGVLALGKRLGISPMGSFVAAAIWAASGPFLSLGNLWNHLAGAAWMPWVLLAAETTRATGKASHALLWGATLAAQILAGSPDFFAMTALLSLLSGLRGLRQRDIGAPSHRRRVPSAGLALAFAIGLSAAQVLPSLELANRSERWRQAAQTRTYWSVHPAALLQVLVPVAFDEVPLQAEYRNALFEGREPYLFSLYLGLPVLALALAALSGPRRPLRALFVAIAVAGTFIALGRHAAVYDALAGLLPPVRVLRFPAKALVPSALAVSILAGMGFDTWREPAGPKSLRRFRIAVFAPVLVAIGGTGLSGLLALRETEEWVPIAVKLGIVAGLGLVVVLLASLRSRGAHWARPAAAGVGLLALVDLAIAHRDLNPTAPKELFTARPAALDVIRQRDHRRLYVYDYLAAAGLSERHLGRSVPYPGVRSDSPLLWTSALAMRICLLPPTLEAWGVYDSYSRDGLGIQPRTLAELNALLVRAEGTPIYTRLLRIGAVSQVLALHADGFEDLLPAATLRGPYAEPMRVFDVPAPQSRTYMVGNTRIADGAEALELLMDPSFDPAREVILDQGLPRSVGASFSGESRILHFRPDRIEIESDANDAGYVVLVDSFDPGWTASVDGKERPVVRANVAFRAVAVPPGRHAVEFAYRPRAVAAGTAISGVAILAAILTAIHSSRR